MNGLDLDHVQRAECWLVVANYLRLLDEDGMADEVVMEAKAEMALVPRRVVSVHDWLTVGIRH